MLDFKLFFAMKNVYLCNAYILFCVTVIYKTFYDSSGSPKPNSNLPKIGSNIPSSDTLRPLRPTEQEFGWGKNP